MPSGPLHPRLLLRHLCGTSLFLEYCERRGIPFPQVAGFAMRDDEFPRWREALESLPEADQARVELELAQVDALRRPGPLSLLCEAARGRGLPPESVPAGPPLALWFLLHRPDVFRSAYLQVELADAGSWRVAQVPPGIAVEVCVGQREALGEGLRAFFAREGAGRFCAVEAHEARGAACFVAYVSDRLHLLDLFADDGTHTTRPARPAFNLVYLYDPRTGRLLLKARQRSTARVLEIVRLFGRVVLGADPGPDCLAPAFRLDRLKRPFDPPPDRLDMEGVRVRALHLAYPGRAGRRRVKLEALAGDSPGAIAELLAEHGGRPTTLDDLAVLYAELEVRLRGDGRSTPHIVRLWPDRSNLGSDPLGERLRQCLRRWGIDHAG